MTEMLASCRQMMQFSSVQCLHQYEPLMLQRPVQPSSLVMRSTSPPAIKHIKHSLRFSHWMSIRKLTDQYSENNYWLVIISSWSVISWAILHQHHAITYSKFNNAKALCELREKTVSFRSANYSHTLSAQNAAIKCPHRSHIFKIVH